MKKLLFAVFTLAAGALFLPQPAEAQVSNWELNLHGGVYQRDLGLDVDEFDLDDEDDDTDTDPLLGARLQYNFANGFGIGANFDWVLLDQIPNPVGSENEDMNVNLYMYDAELHYAFPAASRGKLFLGAGVGAATRPLHHLAGEKARKANFPRAVAGGFLGVRLQDGRDHRLAPEDLNLVMQPLDGYEVEAEAGRAVALARAVGAGQGLHIGAVSRHVRALPGRAVAAGLEPRADRAKVDIDVVSRDIQCLQPAPRPRQQLLAQ